MAYMMLAKDDPLDTAANIYSGYTEHVTLTEVMMHLALLLSELALARFLGPQLKIWNRH